MNVALFIIQFVVFLLNCFFLTVLVYVVLPSGPSLVQTLKSLSVKFYIESGNLVTTVRLA